jgi:anti-sigma B factor antagonist
MPPSMICHKLGWMKITDGGVLDGTTVLGVSGDLDHLSARELSDRGTQAMSDEACKRLVIDLSGVDFADSTGLGALIVIRNASLAGDRTLMLRHPSPWVARVLQVTGLDTVFDIED